MHLPGLDLALYKRNVLHRDTDVQYMSENTLVCCE
ncbi:hypothetical protein ES702_03432 [subsurface metagenome]